MMFIIDLMGDEETVISGTDASAPVVLTEAERIKREEAIYEIAIHTPQPQVVPVES